MFRNASLLLIILIGLNACTRTKRKVKSTVSETKTEIKKVAHKAVDITIESLKEPEVSPASIQEKYALLDDEVKELIEHNGVEFQYFPPPFASYYYKYEAHPDKIQEWFSSIKYNDFRGELDEKINAVDHDEFWKRISKVNSIEKKHADFFYSLLQNSPRDFEYYRMIATPELHLIAINRKTNLILHRVEVFKE